MERHRHRDDARSGDAKQDDRKVNGHAGGGTEDEFASHDARMGDGFDRDKAEGDREDFEDVPGADGGDDIGGEGRLSERPARAGKRRAPPKAGTPRPH
jgi:hypothetical protein